MKTNKLKFNPNNPRKCSKDKLEKLMRSIESFPEMMKLRPIVYDPETMYVLGGNQRLAAIRKLGMKDIPDEWAIAATDLTPEQQKEFVLRDNVQLGDWDFEMLSAEFGEFDLGEMGMDMPEINVTPPDATEDDFDEPDIQTVQTDIKRGDIIEIGRHRLMCGDSTSESDVARLMNGQKVDMVLTDPPYGVSYKESKNWAKPDHIKRPIENDDKPFVFSEYAFPKARCYSVWGANYFCSTIPNYDKGNYTVWAKAHSEEENKVFGSSFELCWQYPKHKQEIWFERRINMNGEEHGLHPTQKPISVMKRCIEYHKSEMPNHILDLFIGSDTTMVACHQLDRICYGMEISEQYCQVIVDRMRKLDSTIEIKINGEIYV